MGKGTDLWDDSALINAFDNAMATYKTMHSGTYHGGSAKEEKYTSDSNHDDHVPTEEVTRNCELEDGSNCGSKKTEEPCMPNNLIGPASDVVPTQEYHLEADASESYQHPIGQNNGYSDQQNEEYNQLLKWYYELEEQRQGVLQRLHQAGCWNHQTPAQAPTGDMPQISAHGVSQNGLHLQCSPCFYQCPASSIVPISCATNNNLSCGGPYCCSLSMQCCSASLPHQFPVYPAAHSNSGGDTAVKTAMMAAERAISSTTMNTPATSNVSEDKEKGKEDETSDASEEKVSKNANPEANLTAVLNAWYAAGFHTGRYLMEQSKRNTS